MTTHHNHHTNSITRILIYLSFPSITNTNISGQKAINKAVPPFPHKKLNKTNIIYSTLYKMKHTHNDFIFDRPCKFKNNSEYNLNYLNLQHNISITRTPQLTLLK